MARAHSLPLLLLSVACVEAPPPLPALSLPGAVASALVAPPSAVAGCVRVAPPAVESHRECSLTMVDGRLQLELRDSAVAEVRRTWLVTPAAAPTALRARRDTLAQTLGAPRECYGQLWVWTGPDWHAILALHGPDVVPPPASDSAGVLFVVRAGRDAICPVAI